jgi:FkbM family methyltransferase
VVVDIGMHIGGFCQAALGRGSGRVYGFEAEAANFAAAARRLKPYGDRARICRKAVWRSDIRVEAVKFTGSFDLANTGGGGMIFWEGDGGPEQEVEAVPFDDVILHATEGGHRRVRLLKIDCEGSEFPILLTSRTLHLVDAIAGEYHEVGGPFDSHSIPERARVPGVPRFTIEALTEALEREGFRVTSVRHPGSFMGLFYADRPVRRPSLMGRLASAWERVARRVS